MKKAYLILSFLFISTFCFAQNYNPFTPGVNKYYINADGYLRGMRIDSVNSIAGNEVYYPFRSPRNYYQALDNNGGSWLGKEVTKLPDGSFLFDNLWNNTVLIKTQAMVNDSWTMYDDTSSVYYIATVASVDTMTVLGAVDSIKTITITAYDSLQVLSSDPLNNLEIILSKAHGIVQAIDLYTFPAHAPGQVYQDSIDRLLDENPPTDLSKYIFKLVDFHVPTEIEIYDYSPGNAFGKKGWEVGFFDKEWIDTIINKTVVNSNQIEYTLQTNKKIYTQLGWNYSSVTSTLIKTNAFAFNMNMPEESGEWYFYYYNPSDTSQCYTSATYKKQSNFIYTSSYGSCGLTEIYKQKFGRTFYGHCFSLDPGDSESDWMLYSNKNSIPCGYLANPMNTEHVRTEDNFNIYPNPANDLLFIRNENKQQLELSLLNIYGQLLISTNSKEEEISIPVTELAHGIYNLRVTNNDGAVLNKKVLIQH